MTANAFMSVSQGPLLVAVALSGTATMSKILEETTQDFAMSIHRNN